MIQYLSLLIFFFSSFSVISQSISGIVTDKETGDPLIGVNVILSNTNGTTTNLDGLFNLEVKNQEDEITFKYIGYETIKRKILWHKSLKLNIEMEPVSQEISTVVISAGKFEQKIEEITVSMEVISPSLIENKNTTNIETAVDQIPGVNITDGQANIRGGSGWSYGAGSRVLVMVDDMPLISGDAGQVQWKLIATENINQVEVIKGASSVLYGSSALNGVINIRTAFPKQKEIENHPSIGYTKINTHYGLIDFPKRSEINWWGDKRRVFKGIELFHAQKINNLQLTLGGNLFEDQGYREGEIIERERVNFSLLYSDPKQIGLSYGVNGNFLFQSSGSALIWNGYNDAYRPLNGEITTTNGDTYNIDPFIQLHKGNNKHSIKTRYLKVINDNSTQGIDNNQDNQSEVYYADYQWQKSLENYQLRITSGLTNESVVAKSDIFQGLNTRENHSLYTQLDKKVGKLNISAGARYEYFSINSEEEFISSNGDTLTHFAAGKPVFRTGINYQLAEATFLRSSWGQGYRFPSMAELFITANHAGIEIYANPELKPESGWSSEIGIKQGLKHGDWIGYVDAAAFIMRYDNMMEFTFGKWDDIINYVVDNDGNIVEYQGLGFKSLNVGKTEISGLEFSMNGKGNITENLSINLLAGYTYIRPVSLDPDYIYETNIYQQTVNGIMYDTTTYIEDLTYNNSSSDSTILKYRYRHIAKLDAEMNYKDISIGASFRYNDFMSNIDQVFVDLGADDGLIPGINTARSAFSSGDFIVDIRAGYYLNKNTKFGLIINNLLNREYMSRPADMQPPRTISLQCSLKI